MSFEIRFVRPEDEKDWRRLWAAYLEFYEVQLDGDVTDATWSRLNDPDCPMAMRVAATPGGLLGFAIHLPHPSTWVKQPDCYLEDLFIDENLRGQGVGRALMDDLVQLCEQNGWARLYWHSDEDNARARKLYDSFVKSDGHLRYRLKIGA